MKNIYIKELKYYRKNIIFWSLGLILFLLAAMAKYQGYVDSGVPITEVLKGLPAGFSAFFGINNINLESAGGFYAVIALYLSVMLGIQAVLLGSSILAKEENDKTAEFLFTKPQSRSRVVLSKLLAAITILIVTSVVYVISAIIIVGAFNKGQSVTRDIIFLMPAIFATQIIFLAIGLLFAAVLSHPKRASQYAAVVLLATFVLSVFIDIDNKFDFLKFLTPFKYFDIKIIYADKGYDIGFSILAGLVTIVLIVASFVRFKKRDLNIS